MWWPLSRFRVGSTKTMCIDSATPLLNQVDSWWTTDTLSCVNECLWYPIWCPTRELSLLQRQHIPVVHVGSLVPPGCLSTRRKCLFSTLPYLKSGYMYFGYQYCLQHVKGLKFTLVFNLDTYTAMNPLLTSEPVSCTDTCKHLFNRSEVKITSYQATFPFIERFMQGTTGEQQLKSTHPDWEVLTIACQCRLCTGLLSAPVKRCLLRESAQ